MFPDETHIKILQRIDRLESNACTLYRQLESLRMDLQRQWKVLPSGEKWTEERHEETRHSAK